MRKVRLTFGDFLNYSGNAATMAITIRAPRITDMNTGHVYAQDIDVHGKTFYAVELVPTDAPGISPAGFTYHITVNGVSRNVSLPWDVAEVDYDILESVEASHGIVYFPGRTKGDKGEPGNLSPAGIQATKDTLANSRVAVQAATTATQAVTRTTENEAGAVAAKDLAYLSAQSAAQKATQAEAARDVALAQVELFEAPAKGVLDSIMGGDVAGLAQRVTRLNEVATNVRDYGATGNGVSDDSAAIQAALNAAGVGARIIVPPGIYKCSSTITTPAMSSLEGSTLEIGVGGTGTTEFRFSAVAGVFTGVALGASSTLSNIIVRGPGTATGTTTGITGASVRLNRVAVLNWGTGVSLVEAYYAQLTEVEWNRNGTGLLLTGCYNVNLYGPRFSCDSTVSSTILGVAINGGARGLNIFGGSFELYKTGILLKSAEMVNLYGVYFETTANAGAIAVSASSKNNITVNVNGCFVYLNGHISFIYTVGSTDVCLLSSGNHFACATTSVQAPIAYNMTAGQDVSLRGDNWKEVLKTGSSYAAIAGGGGFNTPGMSIQWPKGHPGAYGGAVRPETGTHTQLSVDVAQTVAVTGAVSMDATYASHAVTLQANATSSTITNGISGQQITVTVIQDATGGRSFVWPTNAAFAGGAAPATSPANTRTTVTFKYSSAVNRWHEVGRVQGVPVS